MTQFFIDSYGGTATPVIPVTTTSFATWIVDQNDTVRHWIHNNNFCGEVNTFCIVPDNTGKLTCIVIGVRCTSQFWDFGFLADCLPNGVYQLDAKIFQNHEQYRRALLAFALGAYRFQKYRQNPPPSIKMVVTAEDKQYLLKWQETIYLIRDLINTPTKDLGPSQLAQIVTNTAKQFDAKVNLIEGDKLLSERFEVLHAVGCAGSRPPVLIDMHWGDSAAPKVTLVGKGVCFDSGGLNIKPAKNMLLMKKDMGGAAHVLGLARMIMQHHLPVRLRLIIGAAENAIGSLSYRPGDILKTRSGKTVEVTNTDAEGRLVMCDPLHEAALEKPDLLIDFATLTGAARVALGPEVTPYFTNDEKVAQQLEAVATAECDPLWRLPLYQSYRDFLKSDIADLANSSAVPYAGSITAALFLQEFVPDHVSWVHFDIFGWKFGKTPGRSTGGEAMAIRAVFSYLKQRYGK